MAKAKEKMEALVPVEEQPYTVPANWRWVRLLYSFDNLTDSKKKIQQKDYLQEGNIPIIDQGKDVIGGYTNDEKMAYTEKLPVIIFGDHTRNVKYIDFIFAQGADGVKVLRAKDFLLPLAFYYSMLNLNIPNMGYRRHFPLLKNMSIAIAPITEQQRIVDHIGSLFAKLDEAKEKAQAVVDGYEDRKAAILHKAFTGKLTEKWRNENSINIPWKFYRYAELGSSKLGKMLDAAKNQGKPVEYLRNINVRWFAFDLDDVSSMLATEEECSNLSITDGDLLICEGGEPGRCAVWHGKDNKMIFQKALHRFRPYEYVLSEFVGYNLYYMSITGELEKHFTGTTIKHLTGKSLAEIVFKIPSVEEQKAIVRNLDQFMDRENEIVSATKRVLDQIECLKKSILAKAFRGELGTNDPSEEPVAL